jgi:hypothetical protein
MKFCHSYLLPLAGLLTAATGIPTAQSADTANRNAETAPYEIVLIERTLFGPGPLPDQKLAVGHVSNMHPMGFLDVMVPAANNGPDLPNVSGEALQGTPVDGKLSDNTLINENIDMGNAVLMNGKFNLLLAAVYGGPHNGDSHFHLDGSLNWTIEDDIAIDPGFADGVIKINNFEFTTGPKPVPYSLQTTKHVPGGTDQVGSLTSGETIVGRLGDDDFDGLLDGVFLAMGNFPYSSILLPGAPFVQALRFKSNIPVSALDAALLSAAAARNSAAAYIEITDASTNAARSRERLLAAIRSRLDFTARHVERANKECRRECPQLKSAHSLVQSAIRIDAATQIQDLLRATDLATRALWEIHITH